MIKTKSGWAHSRGIEGILSSSSKVMSIPGLKSETDSTF